MDRAEWDEQLTHRAGPRHAAPERLLPHRGAAHRPGAQVANGTVVPATDTDTAAQFGDGSWTGWRPRASCTESALRPARAPCRAQPQLLDPAPLSRHRPFRAQLRWWHRRWNGHNMRYVQGVGQGIRYWEEETPSPQGADQRAARTGLRTRRASSSPACPSTFLGNTAM